jgi:hypothetical protein
VPPGYPAPWNAWSKIAATAPSLASILAGCTKPGTQTVWLTEYGAPTNGPGIAATIGHYHLALAPGHVDEALQAQMATDALTLARAAPSVGALFWYGYKDMGTDRSDAENFFGLRRFDGSAKPAYSALAAAIATPS